MIRRKTGLHESRRSDITSGLMSKKFNFNLKDCYLANLSEDGSWLIRARYCPKFEFLDLEYIKRERTLYIRYKKKAKDELSLEEEQFEAFKIPAEAQIASRRWNQLLLQSR